MFLDQGVSQDLNEQFKQPLYNSNEPLDINFQIEVRKDYFNNFSKKKFVKWHMYLFEFCRNSPKRNPNWPLNIPTMVSACITQNDGSQIKPKIITIQQEIENFLVQNTAFIKN